MLKVIYKIINNILLDSNNLKYQNINKNKLSQKISNNDIWLELLLLSGFYESDNGHNVLFNPHKLAELKFVYNILLSHQWNNDNESIKTDLNVDSKLEELHELKTQFDTLTNQTEKICICGTQLTKIMNPTMLYDGNGAFCDVCGKNGADNDVFWHCSSHSDSNEFHTEYDVCNNCMNNLQITSVENKNKNIEEAKTEGMCQILTCVQLQHMIESITMYNFDNHKTLDNQNILNILNDYLHVIHQHDYDEHFEYIVRKLGDCDIIKCKSFMRNYRNRDTISIYDGGKGVKQNINDIVYHQIMDKIHCSVMHCYDIGSRLTTQEKRIINNIDKNNDYDQKPFIQSLTNKRTLKIGNMLQSKRKIYSKINNKTLNKRTSVRFNQLSNDHELYNFGVGFLYGFDDETFDIAFPEKNWKSVASKYSKLKEELISNIIYPLRIEQFNSEYTKALTHFNCVYCKQYHEYIHSGCRYITVDNILSLMIYCNYDILQYEFSKTYRKPNDNQHSEFYWLARNLKISIHHFGTLIFAGKVKYFYHGINKKLTFSGYVGQWGRGVQIFIPLSTSSSYEVAANFAQNNGLIAQFGASQTFEQTLQYFPVFWLSDYPAEKEHLFVQMKQVLAIYNIIDTQNGFEYDKVIHALHIINMVMDHNLGNPTNISQSMVALIKGIISNQVSHKLSQYKSLNMTEYCQRLCDKYFQQKYWIRINLKTKNNSFLTKIIFKQVDDSQHKWINLSLINVLFPKLNSIMIDDLILCSSIFEDMLDKVSIPNPPICIWPNKNSPLTSKQAVKTYSKRLKKIGVFIWTKLRENSLLLHEWKYAKEIIDDWGDSIYFGQ